jgi:hypothetical protein
MVTERGETYTRSKKKYISIGKLASEGYIAIFTDKAWKVTKGSLVMEK